MNEIQVYLQSHFTLLSLIEIGLLTFLFFQMFTWIKGTQAEQVVRGLIFLLVLMPISELFGFTTLTFLIRSVFTWIFLLVIIVFQPELRSALEQLGSNFFIPSVIRRNRQIDQIEKTIEVLINSVEELSISKTGALIVCEAQTGLRDIAATGTEIDARLTPQLILNLFYNKAPLHDGAVIVSIDTDTVVAAGCILPLTGRLGLPHYFGTRHRAGIGISEKSDALTIIVSEETGKITATQYGEYEHHISLEDLKEVLYDIYVKPLEEAQNNERGFLRQKFWPANKRTGESHEEEKQG